MYHDREFLDVPLTLFKLIHLFAVLICVGDMFFAYAVLCSAAVEEFEPPQRLRLWNAVLRRFFNWVWVPSAQYW